MKLLNSKNIIFIGLFIAIIIACGFIRISVFAVPFTLQTLAVMLAACFLGLKRAMLAVIIYIAMGLIGLPVFTKGGGIFYIFELSFGYILGFFPITLITAVFKGKAKKNFFMLFVIISAASLCGLLTGAVYAYFLLQYTSQASSIAMVFSAFFITFIPAELLKSLAATALYFRMNSRYFA